MLDWQVLVARLTVFVTPDTAVPETLFRDVVGEEAENSVVQRAAAIKTESGPFAGGSLTLQMQPIRIDWVHEAVGLASEGVPAVLGIFPRAVEPILQLGHRWVEGNSFPATQRFALGVILISATSDRETGYRELAQFIDGVPNTPDASDFLYQVNRPRASRASVDGLGVNRLSKWSVGAHRVLGITAGAGPPTIGALHFHLRLELDINTNADFPGAIPREKAQTVIDDLFAGAREICEQGNRF